MLEMGIILLWQMIKELYCIMNLRRRRGWQYLRMLLRIITNALIQSTKTIKAKTLTSLIGKEPQICWLKHVT